MLSQKQADRLINLLERLTAGGGVTQPDDIVSLDDVEEIVRDEVPLEEKVARHANIVHDLTILYQRKNHDYGDSFAIGMKKYGLIMPIIRLEDKLNRLSKLATGSDIKVKDESMRDTLLDMANYAIMTVIEMDMGGTDHD